MFGVLQMRDYAIKKIKKNMEVNERSVRSQYEKDMLRYVEKNPRIDFLRAEKICKFTYSSCSLTLFTMSASAL